MSAVAIAGFVLPVATGLFLVPRLLAPGRSAWLDGLLRLPMAIGLGVGLHASGYFLSLLLFDGGRAGTAALDAGLFLLSGAVWLANRSAGKLVAAPTPARTTVLSRALILLFAVVLLASLFAFIVASIEEPHGGWDAWAIWNLRARFLAKAGTGWPVAFSGDMQHTDYPLLVPAAIARVWSYAPGEPPCVPIVLVMLFALSAIALTSGALAVLRSSGQALLAGLFLAPVLLNEAAYQYADIQVGFYLLLSLVLLAWHDRMGGRERRLVVLAGLAAAMAAWTKNEGLLFLLAVVFGRIVASRRDWVWLWPFLAGAVPVLALLAYFKLFLAPSNDLLPHLVWRQLLRVERYRELAGAIAKEVSGSGRSLAAALVPLGAYPLLLGRSPERLSATLPWLVTLLVSIVAFLVLYLVSPRELEWFVANSLERLALQLYPVLLLVTFFFAASPEERLGLRDA